MQEIWYKDENKNTKYTFFQYCLSISGADLGYSRGERGGGGAEILSTFFLVRPNWFSELSQITIKTPFWPNFLRRMQIFEKNRPRKTFLGFFWQKIAFFFRRALPSQN